MLYALSHHKDTLFVYFSFACLIYDLMVSRERSSSSSRPSRGSPTSSFSSSSTPRPTSQPTFPTSTTNPSLTDLDPWESAEARTQMPPPSAPPSWGGPSAQSSTSPHGAPPTWRGAQPPQPTPRGQSWAPHQPSTAHNGFSQFRFSLFVFCYHFCFVLLFVPYTFSRS